MDPGDAQVWTTAIVTTGTVAVAVIGNRRAQRRDRRDDEDEP